MRVQVIATQSCSHRPVLECRGPVPGGDPRWVIPIEAAEGLIP